LLVVGIVGVVLASAWLFEQLFLGPFVVPVDFAEYWAAGYLNVNRQDPYSGANVLAVQRSLGWDTTAIMMWNPPWALTLVMPLGLLPFQVAHGLWLILSFSLVMLSADLLWRGFGGEPRMRWVAQLLALTFGPTVFLIGTAQITAFVLVGLAGFVYFAKHDRPLLAGACAALTAVKPHLLSLFALWLLLDATRSAFGRKVIIGGVLVGVFACVPPTLANPDVWSQYWEATHGSSTDAHHHYSDWTPPLVGWWLRQAMPGQPFLVQWLSLVFAVVGFFAWWVVNRRRPMPREACVPWFVGLSLLVAPYGAWTFDLVLLLVPVLAVAVCVTKAGTVAVRRLGCVLLLGVDVAMLVGMQSKVPAQTYVWVTPVILVACRLVSSRCRDNSTQSATQVP
jgi:hypothetical protein